ncbi:hypothetical protein AVEN_31620-1 [Araneus ventricosus]|uniref:Uncharacterized protein n=1 Tax=Araneus ventricosus TaxID=182803 RepID=A0A4Y2JC70_ARAVE|nr:hypothetical protein AVEN_31620-1 [Araneus ventricosus]
MLEGESKESIEKDIRVMTNDHLVTTADSGSKDYEEEDKMPLTYKKLKEFFKNEQELSDFSVELYPTEERRGLFV